MGVKLRSWVELKRDETDGHAFLEDGLFRERLRLDEREALLVSRLDGKTDPHSVDCGMDGEEIDSFLAELDEELLTCPAPVERTGFGSYTLPLFFFGPTAKRTASRILDTGLRLLWIPVFAWGIPAWLRVGSELGLIQLLLGILLGLAVGMPLHECAHAFTALAHGARLYEAGVMLLFFRPCAYVVVNEEQIRSRFGKISFHLAGVKMNLLLFGVFVAAARLLDHSGSLSCVLSVAGLCNAALGITNMTLIRGVDGSSAIGALLGNSDYVGDAIETLLSARRRRRLRRMGLNGYAALLAACLALLSYLVVPATVYVFAREVIRWLR